MFENLTDRLTTIFSGIARRGKLTEADVDAALGEVRLALLEADVNLNVVTDFLGRVRAQALGANVLKSLSPAEQVVTIVHHELINTLGQGEALRLAGKKLSVVMLVGLQGSGKTTTAAKLAQHLQAGGQRPYLIAADTQRPAAIDQLQQLGQRIDVPVYTENPNNKPPDISKRGVKQAQSDGANVVIVDTAGRLQIDDALMNELVAIKRRVNPDEILLVADAMTGQEAVRIAQGFHKRVGLTGLILTKTDGDARGGAAISMRAVTGVPIKFLGTGEKLEGFEIFYPDRLADRILGMGDVQTLVERAEAEMDLDDAAAERLIARMMSGEFSLEDFVTLMRTIKKLGPFAQVMGMLPGMGQLLKDVNPDDMDKQLERIAAIISSMTLDERRRPDRVMNSSRKRRIAAGSGTTIQDVNHLLRRFEKMRQMMRQLGSGGLPFGLG